ncbi:MAG TPA: hypothetical protein DIW46_08205 [Microbacterium sp.]|nr:hypothetical protein [Microbacterium sp.]
MIESTLDAGIKSQHNETNPMRIGIFTQWYDPEPGPAALMGVLARELVARGHDVYVLTGFPNYPSGRIAPGYRQRIVHRELKDGVRVTRVPIYPSHNGSAFKRLINYVSFGVSATLLGVPRLPKLDAVWVNFSPITLSMPLRWQQLRSSTPTVCEVADLWPDTLLVAGLNGSKLLARASRFLKRWCFSVYRAADAVVYISPGVGNVLESRGVNPARLHYIPKPANEQRSSDTDGGDLRASLGLPKNRIVLLYAGALGEAQGLDTLIDACALRPDLPLEVLIAGSGVDEESLRRKAVELGRSNITFLGRIDETKMRSLYEAADACYLSLSAHVLSKITMPSKTQAILYSGKPVLCAAEGDVAELIEGQGVGLTADPGDVMSIAAALDELCGLGRTALAAMGERAAALYEEEFSARRLGDRAEGLLREVTGAHRPLWHRRTPALSRFSVNEIAPNEVSRVVALHRQAFPDFFLSRLGAPFLAEFYRGFIGDPTAIVAVERDAAGAAIGIAVGTIQPDSFFRRLLKKRLLGFLLASARAAIRDPRTIPRLLGAVRYRGDVPDALSGALLSSINVDPVVQGTGVGRRLLQSWIERAREMGVQRAFLTTDAVDNQRTNDFYATSGWVLHDVFTNRNGRKMNRYVREFAPNESWNEEVSEDAR